MLPIANSFRSRVLEPTEHESATVRLDEHPETSSLEAPGEPSPRRSLPNFSNPTQAQSPTVVVVF
ncbi:MAG: hypothetical protein ACK53V_22245, partial [Planctomycetota bacterium]